MQLQKEWEIMALFLYFCLKEKRIIGDFKKAHEHNKLIDSFLNRLSKTSFPILLQRNISKLFELRIVFMANKFYAMAERLGISRRSIFNYLEKLRYYGAEIDFCPIPRAGIVCHSKKTVRPLPARQYVIQQNAQF